MRMKILSVIFLLSGCVIALIALFRLLFAEFSLDPTIITLMWGAVVLIFIAVATGILSLRKEEN